MSRFLSTPPLWVRKPARVLFPHHSRTREWILDRLIGLNTQYRKRPPLDPSIRIHLVEYFKNDIEKLESVTGKDLSSWKTA